MAAVPGTITCHLPSMRLTDSIEALKNTATCTQKSVSNSAGVRLTDIMAAHLRINLQGLWATSCCIHIYDMVACAQWMCQCEISLTMVPI